jgi:proteasome lid subunit RPN8/RPN11
MIRIPKKIIDQIFKQAQEEKPIEACGCLVGSGNTVENIYPMENMDQSTEHFSLNPREHFQVVKQARLAGKVILSVYHTHPESPARPSEEDIKLAYDPNVSYVIASLFEGEESIKSFKISKGKVTLEEIEAF